MTYEFPKFSRTRMKIVDAKSQTVGNGKTTDPTDEEKAWLDIMSSNAPELEVKQKKLSVCTFADIVEYDNNSVKFSYDGQTYTIKKPTNSLQIARARERSIIEALEVLAYQSCIFVGVMPIAKDFSNVPVEAIEIMKNIAENFFFAPYL